jgi:TolB-like protein
MKKILFGIIPLIMLIMACASKPAASGGMTLDQSLLEAADRIDEVIVKGTKIAMINFSSPSDQFSSYVLDELSANLVDSRNLTVIDRQEIDLRRSELNFQFAGEVSDESMQSFGKTLGAQSIVTGSLRSIDNAYRIMIRVLNVETAAIEVQYRTDIANDSRVTSLLGGGRSGGTTTATVSGRTGGTVVPAAQAPASQTLPSPDGPFNIGDTGPAGGFIFYDKGRHLDGWRYMEAASQDLPVQVEWGPYQSGRTSTALGTGKQNTQIIVNYLRQIGESGRAAELAQQYIQNGYTDWFLPSREELNLMYVNLKQKGQGNFPTRRSYWSSSQSREGTAWFQDFDNSNQREGGVGNNYQIDAFHVRPVRFF